MGEAFITRRGGAVKAFAWIAVTYPAGSTCTCTDGSKTLEAKTTGGSWVFNIPYAGTWTVTATDGTNTKSESVVISTNGQIEKLELMYGFYIFKEGSGLTSGYSVSSLRPSAVSVSSDKIVWNTEAGFLQFLWVAPAVALSLFSTLKIEMKCTSRPAGTSDNVTLGVGADEPISGMIGNFNASQSNIYDTTRQIFSVDISSLSDTEYIKLNAARVLGEIYNIWLE